MNCPNCGSGDYNGKSCVNCRYNDGEKLYRPGHMTEAHWQLGVRMGWKEAALKKMKRIK